MKKTVYFIQRGETGPIKIGRTRHDPRKRMAAIQVGSAERLRFLGCCAEEERKIHLQFQQHRMSGEWFLPHREILDFIRIHTAMPPQMETKYIRNLGTILLSARIKKSTYLRILERQKENQQQLGFKPSVGAVIRAMLEESPARLCER